MSAFAGLAALAVFAAPAAPPTAAVALLSALESGDLAAARATLADEVAIMDSSGGTDARSSLEALAQYARGCARSDLSWEYDADDSARAAVTFTWTCPSHAPGQAFVWTAGARVVWVQFGMPPPTPEQ
jgi:SnoaL-like domain